MIQYTRKPIFFNQNRVWRVYEGGYLLGDFTGEKEEDTNYPEEWIASVVEAVNDGRDCTVEGLSIIKGTDITLRELIECYPSETLGVKDSLGILVKYLDSAIRLPIQVHPDEKFSQRYFHSPYGKTEMWLILKTRENAAIYYGFKEHVTAEEFDRIIERSSYDKGAAVRYINKIEVNPGEVYLVPGRAVHAVGYGCLILEVQEPTDYTIQPEYCCGNYKMNDTQRYMGLPKKAAFHCFDYSLYGE